MNILTLNHVHKSFARTEGEDVTQALSDITFTVKDGEFLSIVGPSGCGKSTIMRLIAGLIFPTAGTITLNGEIIKGTDTERGMVFQKPTLFPWLTVKQNLDFTAKMKGYTHKADYESESERLLELAGLKEFRNDFPHQLSGGMAQRLALIRTMINKPRVFLLDEPLGALDAFTRMNMQDEILKLWQRSNHIVLMVTHDIDEALYLGTRIIVMAPRPGRIREDMKNEMPYPRVRTSDEFLQMRKRVLEMLNFGQILN
ncbi:MAG: ABC transporter ATP-binding protein [Synergistaceae bacterium]|nr:ABC transporter ATP-binding protein [Synergistaceae bacterium]